MCEESDTGPSFDLYVSSVLDLKVRWAALEVLSAAIHWADNGILYDWFDKGYGVLAVRAQTPIDRRLRRKAQSIVGGRRLVIAMRLESSYL